MNDRLQTYVALEPPERPRINYSELLWEKVDCGKPGQYYLIPQGVPNQADYIHYANLDNTEGYAGRVLEFKLTTGSVIQVRGPWHSNSKALLHRTGIDLTDKHYTWGFVCMSVNDGNRPWAGISGLLSSDPDGRWVLGRFDRIEELAKQDARELGSPVFYYRLSTGGSTGGLVNPGF